MRDFEELLRPCYGPLERFVRFRIEGADAEDVLQEVLIAASQRLHLLRDEKKFKPWIMAIAQNKCRDYYRQRRLQVEVPLADVENCLVTSRKGTVEAVTETLEQLPEQHRQMLYMTFYEELSQREIAQSLKIPLGTVKSRMHAAKRSFQAAYPYPPCLKGDNTMKAMPEKMPEYTITPSREAPFSVKWEEVMGWFIVPRADEKLQWAMYDFPEKKRTMYVDMEVTGKAKIHGIEGVEIRATEYEPQPSEQVDAQNPVERILVAQLTDTHCRILSESHVKQGVREVSTFLDGDDFLGNWGFGPDNVGNETNLCVKGLLRREGDSITVADTDWPLDIVGRYTVTINGKSYDTVCVWDVECYEYQNGVCSQQFLDKHGRTVLWRRFNRDDWAVHRFGELWTDKLPNNERVTINGRTYVHWYDCITDYVL